MTKIVTISGIEIPILDGTVGISMSGGTDSALLLYILLKHKVERLHIFTVSANTRARTNAIITAKVIEKCVQLTGNSNIIHYVRYVDAQTYANVNEFPKEMIDKNIIGKLYTGVTANPPASIANLFCDNADNTEQTSRDPTVHRGVLWQNLCLPFTNIDKKKISEMYSELGLIDTLFPHTRSCEIKNAIEYYDHCNNCWWCKERNWGFSNIITK